MNPILRVLIFVLTAWVLALPAQGITINLTYDVSVTNSGYLSKVQTALGVVTNTFRVLFTNSSSVNLRIYWGSTGPFTGYPITLGENVCNLAGGFSYAQITNALRGARVDANDSNSVASLPAADPIALNNWYLPRAEAKALNLGTNSLNQLYFFNRNDTNSDGSVTFATDVSFAFSPTNRQVSGQYDFIATAEHEITEAMGRTYGLSEDFAGLYIPFDLFRFTNSGARCFDIDATTVYFSVNKGTNNLKWFSNDFLTTGDDPQDWAASSVPDSFDAEVGPGEALPLSEADLIAMDILGYHQPVIPPPKLTGAGLTNGAFHFSFTNMAGVPFSVFAATQITRNATNWSYLNEAMESPTGHFQYFDVPALTNRYRLYRVQMP